MKRVEPTVTDRDSVKMPCKRTSQNGIAKLTSRLAVPKNYSRMNYLDINLSRLCSQSIDCSGGVAGNSTIFFDKGGAESVR